MKPILRARSGAAAAFLAAVLAGAMAPVAAAPVVVADWAFSEAAGTTLNNTANSGAGVGGAGSNWDVNIAGSATDGSGALVIRNNGGGGSGTRTTYADLGPVFGGTVSSGVISLYTTFSAWNLAAGPVLTLAFIEGNDFSTAEFSFGATAAGLSLSGGVDAFGDGTAIAGSAAFAAASAQALTVRLSVDLDTLGYSLAWDAGSGYTTLGGGQVDSLTAGINSLRLGLAGDFSGGSATSGRFLGVDRIWVVQDDVMGGGSVPEPSTAALALLGCLGAGLGLRSRSRAQA